MMNIRKLYYLYEEGKLLEINVCCNKNTVYYELGYDASYGSE